MIQLVSLPDMYQKWLTVIGCCHLGVHLVIRISTHKYMFALPSISVWVANDVRTQTTIEAVNFFFLDMYCVLLLCFPGGAPSISIQLLLSSPI